MNNNRYCVIMCGGVGSRFWPFSKAEKPKQFIDFFGTGRSLLQMAFDRMEGIVPTDNILLITNESYGPLIKEQLPEIKDSQILLEPARRNTAPCIAWAAYHIKAINPDAKMMVAPSDHLILNVEKFRQSVISAFEFIETHDALVTMGIKPSRPETGYGYIQVGEQSEGNFSSVKTFTEKPNEDLARVFLQSGEFFWNSGMFFWRADSIIRALNDNAPEVNAIFEMGKEHFGTDSEVEYINSNFEACPSISIDFAVMEKAPNVYVETVDFGWNDLGTWRSLYDHSPKNSEGNVTQNCKALMFNSHNNIIAIKGDKLLVTSGLEGYIVADVDDALLIVPLEEEQKIKQYVNEVKSLYGDKYL
ncbi:MAG: mannose-1-phosphate guanylyltransferase [Muribaculaceae bacterium]|nr:mannose-1-phosphate guanylyltransferase [Muribaculaceae bacterium]MBR5685700.1 mannose-1-phosphate guanylyltransferase [Muribaculaceae bacterium]